MLQKNLLSKINNWFIFILLSLMVMGVVVATYFLVDYLRKEEIRRIETFATAMKYQQDTQISDPVALDLILQISKNNSAIPVILVDEQENILDMRNIPENISQNPNLLKEMLQEMKQDYPPFEIKLPSANQYMYFTNSRLLNYLWYSPLLIGVLVLAYIAFSFWFLRTIKKTDEGFVWAGLAKETAHQIGTPLSSMIGWIEILRMENENSEGVTEIEKDIHRLKTISERFSKIGSIPELNDLNLNETIEQNYDYLRTRISNKVEFQLTLPSQEILIPHNRILISWVIENLVKNAVDAMKGNGKLNISLFEKNKNILIDIKDTGSGMNSRTARKIFKPGFSTKKRGWGLGLSLAKRVIKDYHNGDIKVAHTEIGKGTTFRIVLRG